jgi:hypothetical protein
VVHYGELAARQATEVFAYGNAARQLEWPTTCRSRPSNRLSVLSKAAHKAFECDHPRAELLPR